MVSCKNCYIPMVGVMSFSIDKHGGFRHKRYYQCPKCRVNTKSVPISDSELSFRESLHNETKNKKLTGRYIIWIQYRKK